MLYDENGNPIIEPPQNLERPIEPQVQSEGKDVMTLLREMQANNMGQKEVPQVSRGTQLLAGLGSLLQKDKDPVGAMDRIQKSIQAPIIAENERKRAGLTDQLAIAKGLREEQMSQRKAKLADPESQESKSVVQSAVTRIVAASKILDPKNPIDPKIAQEHFSGMSADEVGKVSPFEEAFKITHEANTREENRQKALDRAENRVMRGEQHADRMAQADENRKMRKQALEDREVSRISDHVTKAGLGSLEEKLDQVDTILEALPKNAKGKPKDIPGFGRTESLIPFRLGAAKQLQQLVKGLGNTQLKARSGAAVTTQELNRFIQEFGSGTFESEEALLNGLTNLRRAIAADKSAILAGSPQSAGDIYKGRVQENMRQELPDSGLSNKDDQRLKELRAKKEAGVIK